MQGGSGKGVPLTAYVLLAFLENKAGLRYGPSMQKAAEFLASCSTDQCIHVWK
jgi:hypothetical protein